MLISVIVNNYNYAPFLRRCIESCLEQGYQDKEVIVVDDGSVDESRDVIAAFDDRIRPIFKRNGGQGSALNAGFAASRGVVVVFLDSDDMLLPDCLSEVEKAWRPDLSKIHFNLRMIDKQGRDLGENYCTVPLPSGDLRSMILDHGNYPTSPTSGNAFSRSFLMKVMPMPEEEWRIAADAYLFNLAPLCGDVGAIDRPLGCYRIHDRNASSHLGAGQFNIETCRNNLLREMRTARLIADFAAAQGLKANPDVITNAYPHLQLKMVHDKLADLNELSRFASPSATYFQMSRCLPAFKGRFLLKMLCIHAFMSIILLVSPRLANRLVTFGLRKGAFLFVRRSKATIG
jgi:glycosyltransferase involved in cell wall biosynthesis